MDAKVNSQNYKGSFQIKARFEKRQAKSINKAKDMKRILGTRSLSLMMHANIEKTDKQYTKIAIGKQKRE
jgi:hypothetical protein